MDAFKRNYIPTKNEASTNINQDNKIQNNMINNQNLEESNNLKKEKNIRIQEIMVGDRRMERFDGAEYNNPNLNQNQNFNYNMQNEAQFINNQFMSPDQVNINGFNNPENNFIPFNGYNDQIHQNSIYNNIEEPEDDYSTMFQKLK